MRKHQSCTFPQECQRPSCTPSLSCSSVHRQGLWNCFPSEKYVHFHLPWMALTNESALSFLMPGVPFPWLPPVTVQPITPIGIWLKKKNTPKPRGQLESPSVPLTGSPPVTQCKMTARRGSFHFLGISSGLGQYLDRHTQAVEQMNSR